MVCFVGGDVCEVVAVFVVSLSRQPSYQCRRRGEARQGGQVSTLYIGNGRPAGTFSTRFANVIEATPPLQLKLHNSPFVVELREL
ncbi:hypothetical protein Pmani_038344 [Petrolisthes manimaculis]|uniref:Uncharacterized protein n=1 Tax=Petrolisthes manimaculis TaxID=1843537 RepID=A0AAE1TMF0_9EUCA|nr:hypothetical protein Pmani_038344 [Petrolisthes manimaculis]